MFWIVARNQQTYAIQAKNWWYVYDHAAEYRVIITRICGLLFSGHGVITINIYMISLIFKIMHERVSQLTSFFDIFFCTRL